MIDNNYNKLLNLSIRDFNSTTCRPKSSYSQTCVPSCGPREVCVYTKTDNCDTCPPTQCVDMQTEISSLAATIQTATTEDSNNNQKTALIAGLTTGLVVLALIAVTIAGFVFYRRRKLQKLLLQQQQQAEEKSYYSSSYHDSFNIPQTPSSSIPKTPEMAMFSQTTPISESNVPYHLSHWNHPQPQVEKYIDYNDPQSPFIIGAQSLQIPHLDDITLTGPADPTIRRSLNLGAQQRPLSPTTAAFIERSSSVKVTKYDYNKTSSKRNIPTTLLDDDLDEKVTIKRAVSVKKNNSTSSSITRVGSSVSAISQDIVCAKPTIARINTISVKREKSGSITRKISIKRINEEKGPFHVSLQDTPCVSSYSLPVSTTTSSNGDDDNEATTANTGSIDFYLCPPPPTLVNNGSQTSIQTIASSSSSQSALGDGSITVILESTHQ